MRPLLTAAETCVLLRCCARTLRRLELRGLLRAVRVGRGLRYREEDVQRYAEGRQRRGGERQ